MVPKGLRAKMILLLIIMTPGIPEYLTGSSSFYTLFLNPLMFLLGLGLNIGLYSTGALLIREFSIKYRKGWISILILGCAYGIMEEGISVHTFFMTGGNPVGLLGIYGRYAGVDWVWAFGLTFFHAVFSIGLPLLLLSTAFPSQSSNSLLGKRGAALTGFFYFSTVIVLNLILLSDASRAMPTAGDYLFFLAVSAILVIAAKMIPSLTTEAREKRYSGSRRFYLLGLAVFPVYTLYAFFPVRPDGSGRISPVLDILLLVIAYALILAAIMRLSGGMLERRQKMALSFGLVTPLLVWAAVMEISRMSPLISAVAVIAIIMMLRLRSNVNAARTNNPEPVSPS